MVDPRLQTLLDAFEAREAKERELISGLASDEYAQRREEFLVPIGREAGTLINLLIKSTKAQRILELGACYGYSTLWLADAAFETGGSVTTCEMVPAKLNSTRETIAESGLSKYVEFRLGDALETIHALDGPFDFVLLDLWKDFYVPALDAFYPKLNDGAFIVADNMLQPARYRTTALAYRDRVRSKAGITSVLLPIGNGLELSRYDRNGLNLNGDMSRNDLRLLNQTHLS